MKTVIQRVSQAEVRVEGQIAGSIGRGMLVLLGVEKGDKQSDAQYLTDKLIHLRIFADPAGKMNLSLLDTGGQMLIVSQFTLLGDCRKGRRPGFDAAADPLDARNLYNYFVQLIRESGIGTAEGVFQSEMEVTLTNEGPVTFVLDSRNY